MIRTLSAPEVTSPRPGTSPMSASTPIRRPVPGMGMLSSRSQASSSASPEPDAWSRAGPPRAFRIGESRGMARQVNKPRAGRDGCYPVPPVRRRRVAMPWRRRSSAGGAMPEIGFERRALPNGLRIVLAPDARAPIVGVNIWYAVGSKNERPGRTGFAHLFEHMMFKGSANVEKGQHFALIQAAGGTLNATTWLDRTNYFETLPSHELELALWLEADRMASLLPAMTQEKLDNQRDVVKNERRYSVDNQPYGTWDEKMQALVYPETHPYHHSTIGSMEDLSAASLEDVGEFFATYYAPNNAVLTVAGDFETDEALAMIERHFGPIPANPALPPPPDMTVDPLV